MLAWFIFVKIGFGRSTERFLVLFLQLVECTAAEILCFVFLSSQQYPHRVQSLGRGRGLGPLGTILPYRSRLTVFCPLSTPGPPTHPKILPFLLPGRTQTGFYSLKLTSLFLPAPYSQANFSCPDYFSHPGLLIKVARPNKLP